jgi:hypothetical protein
MRAPKLTLVATLLVACILAAGCGSSGSSGSASGVAGRTAHSGQADGSVSSTRYTEPYSPISSAQFRDIRFCSQGELGGGGAPDLIEGVHANADQSFNAGPVNFYLYPSGRELGNTTRQLYAHALNPTAIRTYGNLLLVLDTDLSDHVDMTITACIHDNYSGEERSAIIAARPEGMFGSLRKWAAANGYTWNRVESDAGYVHLREGHFAPFVAVASLTGPTGMQISVYDMNSVADARTVVLDYLDRTQIMSDLDPAKCPPPVGCPDATPSTHRVQEYPGTTAVHQFAIVPQNLIMPDQVKTVPVSEVSAVAQGLKDAPAPVPTDMNGE